MDIYFSTFLDIATTDLNAFLAALLPPPEGSGKDLGSDFSHDPFNAILRLCWSRLMPFSSPFTLRGTRSKDMAGGQNLDAVGGQPVLDNGSGVAWSLIPVTKSLPEHHFRPLDPQMLHEVAQESRTLMI